ncbi:MAG: hypothetical protein A07HR60_01321, partial [uncultured archaeon A07HR60]
MIRDSDSKMDSAPQGGTTQLPWGVHSVWTEISAAITVGAAVCRELAETRLLCGCPHGIWSPRRPTGAKLSVVGIGWVCRMASLTARTVTPRVDHSVKRLAKRPSILGERHTRACWRRWPPPLAIHPFSDPTPPPLFGLAADDGNISPERLLVSDLYAQCSRISRDWLAN